MWTVPIRQLFAARLHDPSRFAIRTETRFWLFLNEDAFLMSYACLRSMESVLPKMYSPGSALHESRIAEKIRVSLRLSARLDTAGSTSAAAPFLRPKRTPERKFLLRACRNSCSSVASSLELREAMADGVLFVNARKRRWRSSLAARFGATSCCSLSRTAFNRAV